MFNESKRIRNGHELYINLLFRANLILVNLLFRAKTLMYNLLFRVI